jgi:UDP-glucose 4-epimerase
MSILVTGGAGYIGSHACVELLNEGLDIVLLDNFCNSRVEAIDYIRAITGKDFPVYAVDIMHEAGLERLFAQERIEAVVHFAGLKAVGESARVPIEYYRNNISGALNLIKAMERAGCKRMVFSSSATVYGDNARLPFNEDWPTSATSPYAMTKLVIERILQDVAASDKAWGVALLRYFNPIGAHPSGLLGDDPMGIPNNLAPYIAKYLAGRLESLSVFGDDYGTKDGTGVRDYLHVVDLAIGHLRALEYTRTHTGAEAFNLGAGRGYSVLEVVQAFERAAGKKIDYKVAPRRPGDIAEMYADTSKALALLGWKAERSLADMCADAWNFTSRRYGSEKI